MGLIPGKIIPVKVFIELFRLQNSQGFLEVVNSQSGFTRIFVHQTTLTLLFAGRMDAISNNKSRGITLRIRPICEINYHILHPLLIALNSGMI